MVKYYVDTCVWIDFLENRDNLLGQSLGKPATKFFLKVLQQKHTLILTDFIRKELSAALNDKQVNEMLTIFISFGLVQSISVTQAIFEEAKKLSVKLEIPLGDCIHTLIAKENNAILITHDEHFQKVQYLVTVKRP